MSSVPSQRLLPGRRFALLASALSLGAVLVFVGPGFEPTLTSFSAPAYGQSAQRPVGFADIVAKVKPAVISVRVKMGVSSQDSGLGAEDNPFGPNSPFRYFFRRFGENGIPGLRGQFPRRQFTTGQGSGFFISADGYAVTNNHVVAKAESVEITTDDGKTHIAKVIGTDPRTDLALIKVDGKDFPFVKLADQAPRIGDWVLAVGNPFGLGGTVTAGIVSARGRDIGAGPYDDFIQIDAPVNKGNSGGPAFDVDGEVIGVNTAIFSPSGGSVGIAFAIPADTVLRGRRPAQGQGQGHARMDRRAEPAGHPRHRRQPRPQGRARRAGGEPQEGSPAAKAGIKSGDVIVSLDGRPVPDARTLARRISAMAPGTAVKIGVWRNGKEEQLSLMLGELPKEVAARKSNDERGGQGANIPRLGLSLAPAANVSGAGTQGVVVTEVDPTARRRRRA